MAKGFFHRYNCNRIERLHSCDYEFWARVWPGWRSNQIIVAEGSFQTTILNGVGRGHEGSDQTTGNKPFSDETGSRNAIEFYINSLRMRLMLLYIQTIEKSKNGNIVFSRYINEIFIDLSQFTVFIECVNSYFQLNNDKNKILLTCTIYKFSASYESYYIYIFII